jgi:hypothetical protein
MGISKAPWQPWPSVTHYSKAHRQLVLSNTIHETYLVNLCAHLLNSIRDGHHTAILTRQVEGGQVEGMRVTYPGGKVLQVWQGVAAHMCERYGLNCTRYDYTTTTLEYVYVAA